MIKKILKSKWFWIAFIIAVIVAGFVFRAVTSGKKIEYITEKVVRGDVVQTVSATGAIKAATEINLNFKITGRITAMRANIGDEVRAGEVLAQLEGQDLAVNVSRALAQLAATKADLERLIAGATQEEIAILEANVAQAETNLLNAEQNARNAELASGQDLINKKQAALSSINTALTKSDIALQTIKDTLNFKDNSSSLFVINSSLKDNANDKHKDAKSKVSEAKDNYNATVLDMNDIATQEALTKAFLAINSVSMALDEVAEVLTYTLTSSNVSQNELDSLKSGINAQRTVIDSSFDLVQSAKQNFENTKIANQIKIDDTNQAIGIAKKALEKAKADLNYKKANPRAEDISWYQAKVKQAEADLAYAQIKYNETILKAPVDGVIINKNKNIGEQSEALKPIYSILSVGNYEIEVNIPESDIIKIKLDDTVDITMDALTENEVFKGLITKINPAQTEIQDVVYYRVTVIFSTEQPENVAILVNSLKPGMTANVTIETASKSDVLVVSQRAVKELNGKKIVSILENNVPKEKEVAVGLRGDGGKIEVISGLLEGESVVTFVKNGK